MPHAADPHQPSTIATSSFGRGWIPAGRDIGLPDDDFPPFNANGQADWAGWVSHVAKRSVAEPLSDSGQRPSASAGAPLPFAGSGIEGSALPHPNAFTPVRIARFLESLSRCGQVRNAARVAGVSQQTAYVRRRRDPAFAAGWDAALILAREAAEQVLAERALCGITETIWFRGEAVGERQRFDGRLLLAHLARLDARVAAAPGAVHHLAEDFDAMLVALAGGEEPAEAVDWPDPARDDHVEARADAAASAFDHAHPEPEDPLDDAAWDAWQSARAAASDAARLAAQAEWRAAAQGRDASLATLLDAPLERKAAGSVPPAAEAEVGPGSGPQLQRQAECPQDSVNPVNPAPAAPVPIARGQFPPSSHGCRLAAAPESRHAFRPLKGDKIMRRATSTVAIAAALAATALAGPAVAKPVTLTASLAGAAETGGGDADGVGGFKVEADDDSGDFCFTLWAEKIAAPTMAHVHEGAAGADGKPVATIEVTGKDSDACVAMEPELIKKILAVPGDYYVNVHTGDFPKGAIRGQLQKP